MENEKVITDPAGQQGSNIDMDALSTPEGANIEDYKAVNGSSNGQETPSVPSGLPNLDKEIDKALAAAGSTNGRATESHSVADQSGNQSSSQNTSDIPYFHKPFTHLAKKLGIQDNEFKLPDGLSEDNYVDKLTEFIYENTEFDTPQLHPEVERINKALSEGVAFDEVIKHYSQVNDVINLDSKELVKSHLKSTMGKSEARPNGWDDDKIESTITKMDNSGLLDIEAERIRDGIRISRQGYLEQAAQQRASDNQKRNHELAGVREQQISKSVEYLNTLDNIYGVPVSKAEVQEFKDDFRALTTPDETGMAPLVQLLQSNENLVKIAYMLTRGDDSIRKALHSAKEGVKKSFLEKLDPEPRLPKRTGTVDPGKIDLDALAEPEVLR